MNPIKKATLAKTPPTAVNPTRVRTSFSKEFKLQAVELLALGQKSPNELAMELGVRRNQLYKWRDQLSRLARMVLSMVLDGRRKISKAKSSACSVNWRG